MQRGRGPGASSLAVGLGVLLAGAAAGAQTAGEQATRRLLLEQAQAARARGDHQQAFTIAQRAGAIEFTPSLRLFLAEEALALGRTATALGAADVCVREATRDATAGQRDQILARCRELVAQVRPRVATVTITVPAELTRAEVRVNDEVLAPTLWGLPYVVDPGTVRVSATLEGRVPMREERTVGEGQHGELTVQLAAPVVALPDPPPPPVVPPPVRELPPAPRIGAWALVGGGVLVGGVGFALGWAMRQDALKGCDLMTTPGTAYCGAGGDEGDLARARDGAAWNGVAFASLGVGLAAAAGGVVWLALPRSSQPAPERSSLRVEPSLSGFTVRGAF